MRPGISCLNNVQFVFFAPKIMPKKQNTQYDLRVFERRHCKLFRNNRASAYYLKTNLYISILFPMSFSRKQKMRGVVHFCAFRAKKRRRGALGLLTIAWWPEKGSLPPSRFLSVSKKGAHPQQPIQGVEGDDFYADQSGPEKMVSSVYLVTFPALSQVSDRNDSALEDLTTHPFCTRRTILNIILEALNSSEGWTINGKDENAGGTRRKDSLRAEKIVVAKEFHANGNPHYHAAISLCRRASWRPICGFLRYGRKFANSWSTTHTKWWSALRSFPPHLGLKKLDTRVAARKPDAACFLSRKKVRRNTEFLHRPPAPLRDRVRLIERWQFNLRVSTPSVRGSTSIKISYVARATKAKKYKCGN